MKVLCVFGKYNYGAPKRGLGYEYVNFIPALLHLGHEVLFMDSWDRASYQDFTELNLALLRMVEQEHPDVVFAVLMHYEIWLETWEILRDAGIAATVNWTTDDSWKYARFSRLVAPAFHAFTTTYPDAYARYQRDGVAPVLLTQWAANPVSLNPPLAANDCQIPVSFIGTAHGKRPALINALHRRGIDIKCFGHGWPYGPVAAGDITRIIRSSIISLNFANGAMGWDRTLARRTNQIKARTFEVPGAGGFLLTDWANGLDHCYIPGKEIAVFRTFDELVDKIRYYLSHPGERDAIAWAGYERTLAEHTYDKRLAEVLEFALRQREDYFANQGTSHVDKMDWTRFENAVQQHRLDWKLRLLKRILVASCSAVWGRVRGPRAARRLLFALSWRISGHATYSARGLPGRLFYEVS
jgi:spore maturation protein CgeB